MEILNSFLGRAGYLPHGYCFTWSPVLLWVMVGADAAIALSYFTIPVAISVYLRRREQASLRVVAWLFSAFIFTCGLTHVMDVWTIWQPDYGLQALTKVATAGLSMVTALTLWLLLPLALKIPTIDELQSVIDKLSAESRQRRSAEEQLIDVQQNLAVTLASIGAGFIATDREGRVTRVNAVAEQITGWPEAEALQRGYYEVFVRADRPPAYATMNPIDVMLNLGLDADHVHQVVGVSRTGQCTELEVRAALTHTSNGIVRGLAVVLRDLTAQMRTEAESGRLAAIVQSSNDAIIGKTLGGVITSWNGAAERMFGYRADEAIGQPVTMLIPPEFLAEEARILGQVSFGADVPAFDTIRLTKDNSPLELMITVSPIRDARGRVIGASKIARDVSHLRRAEAALSESRHLVQIEQAARQRSLEVSLHEKEVLLKEIHHRVKNNLQVISSLLQLQAGYLRDESARRVFEESRDRIKSMALVHEKLYQSKNMGEIDFGDYVRDLVSGLRNAYRGAMGSVAVEVEAQSVQVDVDRAIPCGLILNELVSNSLKHGFPDNRTGRVLVRLAGGGELPIVLSVEDDGVGWPADFVPAESRSLGLRLVQILARQLQADLAWQRGSGIRCVLTMAPGPLAP
jgi:PAS domain S-box-containing protein